MARRRVACVASALVNPSFVQSTVQYCTQRQWRSLGARSMLDARSFMISTLRSQVGFAAAVAHARLRLSRLELIGGSGRTAGRYAGDGTFPILFGYISYRIRIVLYLNVF